MLSVVTSLASVNIHKDSIGARADTALSKKTLAQIARNGSQAQLALAEADPNNQSGLTDQFNMASSFAMTAMTEADAASAAHAEAVVIQNGSLAQAIAALVSDGEAVQTAYDNAQAALNLVQSYPTSVAQQTALSAAMAAEQAAQTALDTSSAHVVNGNILTTVDANIINANSDQILAQ